MMKPSLLTTKTRNIVAAFAGLFLLAAPTLSKSQDYVVSEGRYLPFFGDYRTAVDVARANGLDYVASEYSGLMIVDPANPSLPKPLGFYSPSELIATSVAVSGALAVVGNSDGGIHLLDVSTPTAPTLIAQFGSWDSPTPIYNINAVWIAGDACVILSFDRLYILDVGDPSNPELTGEIPHDFNIYQGVQQGSYIYFAQGDMGLQILDVSNPASPAIVGGLPIADQWVESVAVSGNRAYLGINDAIEIVDVTNPTSPSLIGSVVNYGAKQHMVASGDVLYVISSLEIWIGDVSDPSDAFGVTSVPLFLSTIYSARISGSGLILAGASGVSYFDVTNPLLPRFAGTFDRDNKANGMAVSGSYLALVAGSGGLSTIDLSEQFPSGNLPVATGAFMADVAGNATHAFVAGGGGGLQVFDMVDPNSPSLITTLPLPGFAWGIDLSGSTALVAIDEEGIVAVDVSIPGSPVVLNTLDLPGSSLDVLANGSVAYVTSHSAGVHVVDISNPSSLTLLQSSPTTGESYRAQLRGDFLFVANGSAGIQVMDASTPADLMPLQSFRTATPMYDIAVSENYQTLVAGEDSQFQVIDFSDPLQPVRHRTAGFVNEANQSASYINGEFYLAGTSAYAYSVSMNPLFTSAFQAPGFPPGSPGRMQIQNGYLYMAAQQAGLVIFDLTDPSKPVFTGHHPVGEFEGASDVELDGSIAYVAIGQRVEILDVSNPFLPNKIGELNSGNNFVFVQSVRVHNELAFVSRESYGVEIFDVSDPAQPTILGTFFSGLATVADMEFFSTYGYFSAGYDGLIIVDLSDPTAPVEIISQDFEEGVWDAQIEGSILYVVTDTAVKVMDFSNPEVPFIIAPAEIGFGPVMTDAQGTTAFTADQIRGLVIVDASNPAAPLIPSTTPVEGGGSLAVQVEDNFVYVAGPNQLHVFDVANLASPALTCRLPISMGHELIAISGSRLVATGGLPGTGGNVFVYEALEDGWSYAGQFKVTGEVHALHLVDETLYLAADQIHIMDLTDPAGPGQLGVFPSGGAGQMFNLRVVGNLLYAVGFNGVYIHDIANPSGPSLEGTWPSSAPPQDIVLIGSIALVANGYDGLEVLDVSNPASPNSLNTVTAGLGEFFRLHLDGDRLLAMGQYQAALFDVSDPTQPVQIGFPFSGNSGDILGGLLEGSTVYLVGNNGLSALDISEISSGSFNEIGGYVSNSGYTSIIRDGSKTYLGGEQLQVLSETVIEAILSVTRNGDSIEINWDPPTAGFELEYRSAPGVGEWMPVPGAVSGYNESMDQPHRIYRLRR